eukprot:TRINITY_DN1803_c0_g1_i1.p1 TRINITY_DN1803_c0_g1~~TRINITY_DN1803_c0_g1_i1.p1  ORF type:complete len:791 (+),score=230.59 TRINITY_DN1803_c0_g1_i1:104-2476(+)
MQKRRPPPLNAPAPLIELCDHLQEVLEDGARSLPSSVDASLSYDKVLFWKWYSDAAPEGAEDGRGGDGGLASLIPRPPQGPLLPELDLGSPSRVKVEARRAFRRAVAHYRSRELTSRADCEAATRRAEEREAAGSEYSQLRLQRDVLTTDIADLRQRLNQLFLVNQRCGQKVRELEDSKDQLRAESEAAKVQRDDAKKEAEEAKIQASKLEESIDDLALNNEALQRATIEAELCQAQAESLARRLQGERDEWRKEAEARRDEVATLTTQLDGMQRERERMTRDTLAQQEQVAKSLSSSRAFFIGKGKARSVPVHLRFTGRIRNLRVEKGALEKVIHEVWAARLQSFASHYVRDELVVGGVAGGLPAVLALRGARPVEEHDQWDYGNTSADISASARFGEFFLQYCQENWRSHAAEWCYSLNDAAERFSYDADVDLFSKVLMGHLPENTYLDQMVVMQKFKQKLQSVDLVRTATVRSSLAVALVVACAMVAEAAEDDDWSEMSSLPSDTEVPQGKPSKHRGKRAERDLWFGFTPARPDPESMLEPAPPDCLGYLPQGQIMEVLYRFFSNKSDEHQKILQLALAQDILERAPAPVTRSGKRRGSHAAHDSPHLRPVYWPAVFQQDKDGNQCQFIECLRDQHLEEVTLHMAELRDTIVSAEDGGTVTRKAVRAKVIDLDPTKPEQDREEWLARVFPDGCADDQGADLSQVLSRLNRLLVRRHGPPRAPGEGEEEVEEQSECTLNTSTSIRVEDIKGSPTMPDARGITPQDDIMLQARSQGGSRASNRSRQSKP